jgi:hypothetical protein
MTELLAFADHSPWWTLVYLVVICSAVACLGNIGTKR